MNILIAATELAPYVAPSPAAEATSSLAKALRLLGHEVTLALPRFRAFEEAGLMAARRLTPLSLADGGEAHVYDVSLPSGARLTLLDAPDADMSAIGRGDSADARALGRYSDAVSALLTQLGERESFDVLHVQNAAAALSLLKLRLAGGSEIGKVLTVHDGQATGVFPLSEQAALGIPESFATQQGFKSGDELCLLKGALGLSDVVVAPSEAYATELLEAARFGALSRSFKGHAPVGILGGVDHAVYNPATDAALVSRYDAQDPSNKGRNKATLLQELGLPLELSRPLVFFEDLEPSSGGLETLFGAAAQLSRLELTLVLSTNRPLSDAQRAAAETLKDQVLVIGPKDARSRRRLLGASDFYLGLERHNPSGQSLLQAARYGAVPVAFAADAARDVIVDADAELETGTGFLFDSLTQRGILGGLGRAVSAYRRANFLKLLSRVMRQDLAWDRPARRYLQIYRQAAGGAR